MRGIAYTLPRLEIDLRGPRSMQPQRFSRRSGQRYSDQGLSRSKAAVPRAKLRTLSSLITHPHLDTILGTALWRLRRGPGVLGLAVEDGFRLGALESPIAVCDL